MSTLKQKIWDALPCDPTNPIYRDDLRQKVGDAGSFYTKTIKMLIVDGFAISPTDGWYHRAAGTDRPPDKRGRSPTSSIARIQERTRRIYQKFHITESQRADILAARTIASLPMIDLGE
jgi:hypothetical protein